MTKRRLDKDAWRRGRGDGATQTSWPTVLVLIVDALLIVTTSILASSDNLLLFACAVLPLTIALLHGALLVHECAHGLVFTNDRYNVALGHVLSFPILCPFLCRRHAHALHHAWTGHPEYDPTNARAIRRFSALSARSLVALDVLWRSWVPFLAFGERVGLWRAPFTEPSGSRLFSRAARTERGAIYLQLTCYVVLLATTHSFDWFGTAVRLYAISFMLLLIIEESINLPHHLHTPLTRSRLPSWQQGSVTHSCAEVWIWSRWILLNFNLHEAHHVWPTRTWHELRAAHQALLQASTPSIVSNELSWNLAQRRRPFSSVLREYLHPLPPDQAGTRLESMSLTDP